MLVVEPEADQTDAVLHVCQPVGRDVNAACQGACDTGQSDDGDDTVRNKVALAQP